MSRARALRSQSAKASWPNLCHFLGGLFHEDTALIWGSDQAALTEGIAELPTERLRELLKELRDLNASHDVVDNDFVRSVQEGFGVNRVFKKPTDAREFVDGIYDSIIRVVKERTEGNWKP